VHLSMPPRRRLPSAVILSPNLGCPHLVAPEEVNSSAVVLVLATLGREQPEVRFVHLTDWHIASRNDLWNTEIPSIIDGGTGSEDQGFVNFNEHLRKFIRWANTAADAGELDFVWALGDLVDFVHIGLVTREPTDNNWSTLIDMFISCPHERERGNEGLRVPLFTTPGNHDWRAYPPTRRT
jgi:Calcineurin-like phosphoesterase